MSAEDVTRIETAYPIPRGMPGDPHRERFDKHVSGELTWLVAWEGDRPCGMAIVRWPGGDPELTSQARSLGCAEVAGLEVDEDVRRRGIGTALMETAETVARKRGVKVLGLEVTASNPYQVPARALYEGLGYREAGFGEFVSGYPYWDADGTPHRDEELYLYLTKSL